MVVPIRVTTLAAGWQVVIEIPGKDPIVRTLTAGKLGLPLPPSAECGGWNTTPYASLCDGSGEQLIATYRRGVLNGSCEAGAICAFGSYLLAVLLGPAWKDIEAAAGNQAAGADIVELELHLEPGDKVIQRLPWEMMISGEHPLGAQQGRTVAITRVIAGNPLHKVEIELPMRILFVIGKQLDQSLRPGAEYLGLIRQLQATMEGGAKAESVDVNLRILPEATTEDLETAIQEFDPAVVHFIAHGRVTSAGGQIVMTKQTPAGVEEDPCGPERIVAVMRRKDGTGRLPAVVVLNACHTGEPNDGYLPFAATLVAEGIPFALGMAGEVADTACRVFTRAFYQSLLDLKPLSVAVARARRAAILHYENYQENVEWVRPTMFKLEGAPAVITVNQPRKLIRQAAWHMRGAWQPAVLCGRLDAFRAYQKYRKYLSGGAYRTVLALEVSDTEETVLGGVQGGRKFQVGKSRLLAEIAACAVLDGLLPCVIPSEGAYEPPPNLLSLAIRIAEVMDDARVSFGMDRLTDSAALELAFAKLKKKYAFDGSAEFTILRDEVKSGIRALGPDGSVPHVDYDEIAIRIRRDSDRLLADINQELNAAEAPVFHSVLLLIDDLHKFEGVALPLLKLIQKSGLAGGKGRTAVAFTYSSRDRSGPEIMGHVKDNLGAYVYEPLRPFRDPIESRLAYTQFLLSQTPPLAPSWRSEDRKKLEILFRQLHDKIRGVPSFFELGDDKIKLAEELGFLVNADDESILDQHLNGH